MLVAFRASLEPQTGSSAVKTAVKPGALLTLSEKNLTQRWEEEEKMSGGPVEPQKTPSWSEKGPSPFLTST